MPKKCILCENEAEYCIKGCPEAYCKECAIEQFQDVDYLQKIEEQEHKKEVPHSMVLNDSEEDDSDIEEGMSEE